MCKCSALITKMCLKNFERVMQVDNKNKLLDTLERIAIALENIEKIVTESHEWKKQNVVDAIEKALKG